MRYAVIVQTPTHPRGLIHSLHTSLKRARQSCRAKLAEQGGFVSILSPVSSHAKRGQVRR